MATEQSEHAEDATWSHDLLRGVRPADVRVANRACVLASLAQDGPASRVVLACRTGLSRVTIGAIVSDLLREGAIREEGSVPPPAVGGRRAALLRLNEGQGEAADEASAAGDG